MVINGLGEAYPRFHAPGGKCGSLKKDLPEDILQKLRQSRIFLSGAGASLTTVSLS